MEVSPSYSNNNVDTSGFTITPTYKRNVFLTCVGIVVVIVALFLAFILTGTALNWLAVGAGALGWIIALSLRLPIVLLTKQLAHKNTTIPRVILLASGPCEEVVRLLALLLLGRMFPIALSIGLGWAAIEAWCAIVQSILTVALLSRDDEKARQAKTALAETGQGNIQPNAPLGMLERLSASFLHISFTLMLAWLPWLVLLTIPTHSGINAMIVALTRKNVVLGEIILFIISALIFVAGLAIFGRI
ncbi:YhfC family intramembrane metalloprotease [Tengunoibacter tsumagoiensis]|uniref:YhfC family intramembrane metalloprotease n=1 Tax=Tengunoibacter tsumagoiensis TaxID=2014871 RepID=A0A402A7J0_9CHLR|nr:YhfC family intramembrane metalloprotease [Tengunoibacter tsumagoiensis]GCE14991.1 hypothetical protein KTT_48500 [Tengunoibacter tsumagoiensis]